MAQGVETLVSHELRDALGVWTEYGRPSFPVDASDIRRWAIAVYWPETPPPIYWNDEYARTTRWGGIIAPPEFNPFAWPVDRRPSGETRVFEVRPGEPGQHLLNGGRTATFSVPMRPGDVVRSRSRVRNLTERQGRFGLTLYIEVERELVNQCNEVVRSTVDTIIRY
jgi:acyl dehydratase